MRKLLQLALSPKPKCQTLTARLLMPGLSPALLPTLSCLKPHLSAAIGASKQKLSTEPVHPTARVQIMVSEVSPLPEKPEVQAAEEAR